MCSVYYGDILLIRERLEVLLLSAMVDARALEIVILEVGNSRGVKVGGSRRVVMWVLNAALLLEMIRYKLAW